MNLSYRILALVRSQSKHFCTVSLREHTSSFFYCKTHSHCRARKTSLSSPTSRSAVNFDQNPAERVPYRFTHRVRGSESDNVLDISNDLHHSLLKPGIRTTEDSISLQFTPQAVFKVRAVSRCSSSIPGHNEYVSLILHYVAVELLGSAETKTRQSYLSYFFLSILLLTACHRKR